MKSASITISEEPFADSAGFHWNSTAPRIIFTCWQSFAHKALSDVLRKLKANASGWMHDVFPSLEDFSWQRGYAAFTVSQSNLEDVRTYIQRQKEHHHKVSFREEFIQFLKANGIEYDERYL